MKTNQATRNEDAEDKSTQKVTYSEEAEKMLKDINIKYMQRNEEIRGELAYRKVVDKLTNVLGITMKNSFSDIHLLIMNTGSEHPALCRHLYYMAHIYIGTLSSIAF